MKGYPNIWYTGLAALEYPLQNFFFKSTFTYTLRTLLKERSDVDNLIWQSYFNLFTRVDTKINGH